MITSGGYRNPANADSAASMTGHPSDFTDQVFPGLASPNATEPLGLLPRRRQLGGLCGQRGRPGTERGEASNARYSAVRHVCTTVERARPNFSAASGCVACWVRTWTKIAYSSLAANRSRGLGAGVGLGFGTTGSLSKDDPLTLQGAGYQNPIMVHEIRPGETGDHRLVAYATPDSLHGAAGTWVAVSPCAA
jgi:hypothetical protein